MSQETIIRIIDDPQREGGVIVLSNLPDCSETTAAALTPAQKAGAMIMRHARQVIERGANYQRQISKAAGSGQRRRKKRTAP